MPVVYCNIFPFQRIFILRLALIGIMTYSDDTQYLVGIIESQDAVNDLVGGGTVGETAPSRNPSPGRQPDTVW